MNISDLNETIRIVFPAYGADRDGFRTVSGEMIACIRAGREIKTDVRTVKDDAPFTDETVVFVFRAIPYTTVTTDMVIEKDNVRYRILSVDNIRKRYLRVRAKRMEETEWQP